MIPLRDVIPTRTIPGVTLSLIGLNIAAFLYELSLGERIEPFFDARGLVPARFAFIDVFTSMFLHGGVLHVAGNMLFLWIFGDNVEDRMGHGRFALFYLLCGTTAALAQTAAQPQSTVPMVGASGAVAGVMGAYFVLYPRSKVVTLVPILFVIQLVELPAVLFLGVWFLLQFLSGLGSSAGAASGGVAFWAHAAGFVTGAAAVFVFRRPERQRVEWWNDV